MASKTLPRYSAGQLTGRVLMAAGAGIVNSIYWLANVRPENKRRALMIGLSLTLTSSARHIDSAAMATLPVREATREVATGPTNQPVNYATGALANRRAGDLYAAYLGYPGSQIPTTLRIDWNDQLDNLWDRKLRRRGVTPVARQAASALVAEYNAEDPGRITLESYQQIAGEQAAAICSSLDWEQVGRTYRLNERKTSLLERVSCNMGGRVILAYAMAELLPSSDGALNRDYLDFLLRNGGRRYVESLPALHDDITSFGPVQFTQYAVYDVPGERRGASRVNVSLPEHLRIPGSTLQLRDNGHLRAAYLFAISNLADGIRSLNGRQLATFERVYGPRGVDVAQFIAVAHNKPANGRRALRGWLDAGARGSLRDYCARVSRLYATKTVNNYNA
jgi:hypothetical protein